MPPGGSSPSPAQPDRGAPSLEVAVAAAVAAAAAVPSTWAIRMFLDLFKKLTPSFILSGRPFFEVIAQGCNWIAVISATGNTKCCNLSINRGGPRQADPYAGERGGGGSGLAHVRAGGPCRAGARGGWGRRPGGGLCICCSKCNKVHFSLAVCVCLYIEQHLLEGETHL